MEAYIKTKNKSKASESDIINCNSVSDYSTQLSDIFKEDKNIAILERKLNNELSDSAQHMVDMSPNLEFSEIVEKNSLEAILFSKFESDSKISILIEDIHNLVNHFCNLFNTEKVWLRLDAVNKPMCPNFHTDDVKCRMVTTYVGPGTQWIPQNLVNKNINESDIMELNTGHVALLKGEGWDGNQGNGLVHRSPHKNIKYDRLYMTIDFIEFYNKIFQNRLITNL